MNPSFTGLLSDVKSTRGIFEGPEQWAQIKDKVSVADASHFLIPASTWLRSSGEPSTAYPAPRPDYVRICCISDTHTQHDLIEPLLPPSADILIHAGDFCNTGEEQEILSFCNWISSPKIRERFKFQAVIAGNHSVSLDPSNYDRNWRRFHHPRKYDTNALRQKLRESCSHYLESEAAEILGLKFYGSPMSPTFYDWGFQLSRDNGEAHREWAKIPADTDILITHGPAMGHGDVCVPEYKHFGDADLLDWIECFKPKIAVSGHLHEGYGATTNGRTIFLNASSLNEHYDRRKPNMPLVMDVAVGNDNKSGGMTTTKQEQKEEEFA